MSFLASGLLSAFFVWPKSFSLSKTSFIKSKGLLVCGSGSSGPSNESMESSPLLGLTVVSVAELSYSSGFEMAVKGVYYYFEQKTLSKRETYLKEYHNLQVAVHSKKDST